MENVTSTVLTSQTPDEPDDSTGAESWILTVLGIILWVTIIVVGLVCTRLLLRRNPGSRTRSCREGGLCSLCRSKCSDTEGPGNGGERSDGSLTDVVSGSESDCPPSYRRAVSMPRPSVLPTDFQPAPPDYDQLFELGTQPDVVLNVGHDNSFYLANTTYNTESHRRPMSHSEGMDIVRRDAASRHSFLRRAGLVGSHAIAEPTPSEERREDRGMPPAYDSLPDVPPDTATDRPPLPPMYDTVITRDLETGEGSSDARPNRLDEIISSDLQSDYADTESSDTQGVGSDGDVTAESERASITSNPADRPASAESSDIDTLSINDLGHDNAAFN